MTLEEAEEKIGQAYQVIGIFAYIRSGDDPKIEITDEEMLRAQDYFAFGDFDPKFLPWPKRLDRASSNSPSA